MFRHWLAALELLGYRLEVRTLTASVHSDVPQRRDRVFVVGVLGASAVGVLDLASTAEPAFGPHVDWDDPEPWWRSVESATPAVQSRIARGRSRHGDRFLTQHVSNHPGVSLSEPIRTITTKDQWAVVSGGWYRPLTIRENARAQGFPDAYGWPDEATRRDCIKGIGNACPPGLARPVIERTVARI